MPIPLPIPTSINPILPAFSFLFFPLLFPFFSRFVPRFASFDPFGNFLTPCINRNLNLSLPMAFCRPVVLLIEDVA